MKHAPQTQQILDHLMHVGSISNVEAQALYRCRSLPRRILDLKKSGYRITTTMRTDHTGQRYGRYTYEGHVVSSAAALAHHYPDIANQTLI